MEFREIVKIYNEMEKEGVVIYGAGKRGERSIEMLEREKIKIHAVADKNRKEVMGYKCVSLEELMQCSKQAVCIVTPEKGCEGEIEDLKQRFERVVDIYIIHFLKYGIMPTTYNKCYPFNHYRIPVCKYGKFVG